MTFWVAPPAPVGRGPQVQGARALVGDPEPHEGRAHDLHGGLRRSRSSTSAVSSDEVTRWLSRASVRSRVARVSAAS